MSTFGTERTMYDSPNALQLKATQERYERRTPEREATTRKIATGPILEVDTPERVQQRIERLGFTRQERLVTQVLDQPETLHTGTGIQ